MIGSTTGHTAERAALVNGVAVHSVLYEDINLPSADHPGAPIVPAALAVAEEVGATMVDLVEAIVLGYETHLAIGAIAANGVKARGFRTTSVFGTVGAAAAAAYLERLQEEQYGVALQLAANLSFGTVEGFAEGSTEPFLHAGVAASLGILAVRFARAGASVSQGTFEGRNGFLRAFADIPFGTAFQLEDIWRILTVSCKAYPISGGKLTSMDSAVAIAKQGISSRDIVRVVARVPESAVSFPGADRVGNFHNYTQAQDSTAFCISAALCGRDVTSLPTFLSGYNDTEVAEFTRRVELIGEAARQLTEITVTLLDGTTLVVEADDRQNQIPSVAAMGAKLYSLGTPLWGASGCDRIVGLVTGDGGVAVRQLGHALRAIQA
jgi:2-methylcitrate dehydratase PrpD